MKKINPWICEKCKEPLGKFLRLPKENNLAIWNNEDKIISVNGPKGKIFRIAFLKIEAECTCGHINTLENESTLLNLSLRPIGREILIAKNKEKSLPYSITDKIEATFNYDKSKKFFMTEKGKMEFLSKQAKNDKEIIKLLFGGKSIEEISKILEMPKKHIKIRANEMFHKKIKPIVDKEFKENISFIIKGADEG